MESSASLWGCELKYDTWDSGNEIPVVSLLVRLWIEIFGLSSDCPQSMVSLLVRLWIEMPARTGRVPTGPLSASLWGCELKYGTKKKNGSGTQSASLWGCELKYIVCINSGGIQCQPPCEAVNWNFFTPSSLALSRMVSLLVRLWIEMYRYFFQSVEGCRQPPCEAVNWNNISHDYTSYASRQPPCEAVNWNTRSRSSRHSASLSASLWGCELKCSTSCVWASGCCQPPCEAVNWNSWLL